MDIEIRDMMQADWFQVAEIYRQGIETGHATFQQTIPTWEEWVSLVMMHFEGFFILKRTRRHSILHQVCNPRYPVSH